MELQFKKESLGWMKPAVRQIQTREQTQELKLSDGMPDVGRILASWGQPILRAKEWRNDGISVSGGTMVWVLYAPEDGTQARCVNGWIPWQMDWDLPAGTPDGQIRITAVPRFVDARSVSPRKIMIRNGVSVLGEGLVQTRTDLWRPAEMPEDVQLLELVYPVRLPVEAGEKAFQLDEELILPQSCPMAGKLLACTLCSEITENRVLTSRLLFRATAKLHVVYAGEDGQVFSWDFPISISQYAQLSGDYGADAQGEIWMMPTDLEVDLDESGHFRLKCGMIAQYEVDDVHMLSVTEDAYSLARALELKREEQTLIPTLEKRILTMSVDQILSQEANIVADVSFLPDFPRLRELDDQIVLEQPGMMQVLYYTPEGSLQSSTVRWEGKLEIATHPDNSIQAVPMPCAELETLITGEGIRVRGQSVLRAKTYAQQQFSPVMGIQPGEMREPDPNRPSLILCRAGEKSLWELARESGSTVQAIRSASGLEGEPQPNRMLLIPVL